MSTLGSLFSINLLVSLTPASTSYLSSRMLLMVFLPARLRSLSGFPTSRLILGTCSSLPIESTAPSTPCTPFLRPSAKSWLPSVCKIASAFREVVEIFPSISDLAFSYPSSTPWPNALFFSSRMWASAERLAVIEGSSLAMLCLSCKACSAPLSPGLIRSIC